MTDGEVLASIGILLFVVVIVRAIVRRRAKRQRGGVTREAAEIERRRAKAEGDADRWRN